MESPKEFGKARVVALAILATISLACCQRTFHLRNYECPDPSLITGSVDRVEAGYVVVDTSGNGQEIVIPVRCFEAAPVEGQFLKRGQRVRIRETSIRRRINAALFPLLIKQTPANPRPPACSQEQSGPP